ncbi:hypothetical protein DAEQUDRAFT_729773 [Daedalea quercina L-15889]|uniref:Uncharacterized protein n=1 Tax=Daedalea quercina L-15889 TaxID=1314783 RepID=A0A165NCK6_9APHY|nr:hypothetical protein DAEQUDRAFT_729773 [Daedalea quercina L-15889]
MNLLYVMIASLSSSIRSISSSSADSDVPGSPIRSRSICLVPVGNNNSICPNCCQNLTRKLLFFNSGWKSECASLSIFTHSRLSVGTDVAVQDLRVFVRLVMCANDVNENNVETRRRPDVL